MPPGVGLTLGILGILGAAVWSRFAAAISTARARVRRGSQVITSRFGQIEFAAVGAGRPVLVVHGAGGGFDQGLSVGTRLLAAGYQVIAPSRFGYLRSSSPDNPSPERQADAFAALLDTLHIQAIPVVGISAGTLSALQFALRHSQRCRSLVVMVPAASSVLSAQGPLPDQGRVTGAIVARLFGSDFLYWLGITLAPRRMIRAVLATDPALVAAASPDERQRAQAILWHILPISERARGLLNDVHFAGTPQAIPVDQIKAPTLVISLEDDYYRTLPPARVIAASVPGARLVTYATGGHVFLGHDAEAFAEVDAFLKQHQAN
jgi:pimeloyl-ACP methyl ester carboxylesterase